MILINNEDEFQKYLESEFIQYEYEDNPRFPRPTKYPCYVYEIVYDWGYQEKHPNFLYKEDLKKMLADM